MVTIEESITTVFWKIFNKLQQESSDKNTFEKSIEVFNNYRGRFKRMADNDIYSTMIQVVFFAGFKAKTVEESLPTILTYLGDFKKVAMYNEEDVQRILKDESMLKNKKKIKACIHNARVFKSIIRKYGSFANYLESFRVDIDDYEGIKTKVVPELIEKFKFIGKVTVYHFLMDLGFGVMKPDRTILRLFYRLGWISSPKDNEVNIDKTIKICRKIAEESGFWIRAVDIVLVAFCQEGGNKNLGVNKGICTRKNPKCDQCPVKEYCKYYAARKIP